MPTQNEERYPSLLREGFTQVGYRGLSRSWMKLNRNPIAVQFLSSKCLLSWASLVTVLPNVILKASPSCKRLCAVLTSDSSMGKHPAVVTSVPFYPPGSEAPAQQEQCGNVGKPLYYFKSRLL